ncbi:MAG: hypothetical protein J5900_07620 [Prevotella sp.]|nr:hypothetical protein [Prevotella sp.]
MNRILSIAILLLTLLTAAEMRAQDMINETGYKCNDGGFEYISPIPCDFVAACEEECSSCQGFFDCDEIKEHEKGCYYECPRCERQMTVIEGLSHYCDPNKEGFCCFCGKPIDQCECSGPVIPGNYPSSGGGGGGGGGGGPTPPIIPPSTPPAYAPPTTIPSSTQGYHRCPCLMTALIKELFKEMEQNPHYNQDEDFPGLTDGIKRHISDPSTIQQGNNGTCGAALIQKWLAENFPKQYIECVYSLAHSGHYDPWLLEFDEEDDNPMGMTMEDLMAENGENKEYNIKNGIDYTYVDALMQSAIQARVNSQDKFDNFFDDFNNICEWFDNLFGTNLNNTGYDPRNDNDTKEAKASVGGMNHKQMIDFMKMVAGENSIISDNTDVTDYDTMYEIINRLGNDFDSYSVFAGVDYIQNGKEPYFANDGGAHYLEISGMHSGQYDIWCYGSNFTTSKDHRRCNINDYIIVKNTNTGKDERINKKNLTCNCSNCSGDGCNKCMSK